MRLLLGVKFTQFFKSEKIMSIGRNHSTKEFRLTLLSVLADAQSFPCDVPSFGCYIPRGNS